MTDVSGKWQMFQGNGFTVNVDLDQADDRVSGSATTGQSSGTVRNESRVEGREFLLIIGWNSGITGEYHGNIGLNNRMTGIAFDIANPGSQATWHSGDKVFNVT